MKSPPGEHRHGKARAPGTSGSHTPPEAMKLPQHGWRSWFALTPSLRFAKSIVVGVMGGTVVLIGIALIILPGPAFIVIPIGLSILATEFAWAKRWLEKARQMAAQLRAKCFPEKP